MTNMGEAGSKTLKNFWHKPEAQIRSSITGTVRLTVKALGLILILFFASKSFEFIEANCNNLS